MDARFDVNVTTTAGGRIIGGSGGHADVAEGARLTIVATPLRAGAAAKLVPRVAHVTTEGRHVDLVVTEIGIAARDPDRAARLRAAGLPVRDIAALVREAAPHPPRVPGGRIVARAEDRRGAPADVVRVSAPSRQGTGPGVAGPR